MSSRLLTVSGLLPDPFVVVADDAPLPDAAVDVVVSLARFLAERPALTARTGRLGVALSPSDDAYALGDRLDGVALVSVAFPSYQDGRGYTHARHLREQLSFAGELRAVGDVGIDHLFSLRRCGFDAFLLRTGEDPLRAQQALARYSVAAQPAAWNP